MQFTSTQHPMYKKVSTRGDMSSGSIPKEFRTYYADTFSDAFSEKLFIEQSMQHPEDYANMIDSIDSAVTDSSYRLKKLKRDVQKKMIPKIFT